MKLMFTEIQRLATPQNTEENFNFFEIDRSTLNNTISVIIADLFVAFILQGDNPKTGKILTAFQSNFKDTDRDIDTYDLENDLSENKVNISKAIGDIIFINKRDPFVDCIAKSANIEKNQAELLVTNLTYAVSYFLGERIEDKEYTLTGLLAQMYAERDLFSDYISPELFDILNTSSIQTIGHNLSSDAKVASHMVYIEIKEMENQEKEDEKEEDTKGNWFKWFSSKAAL